MTINLNQGRIINTNLSFEIYEEMTMFSIFCLLLSGELYEII